MTLPESPGMSAKPPTSKKGAKDYPFGNVTSLPRQSASTLGPLTPKYEIGSVVTHTAMQPLGLLSLHAAPERSKPAGLLQ